MNDNSTAVTASAAGDHLTAAEMLITTRRSSLVIDRERPLDDALVERVCRLVRSAPNHKRTDPWRVAVFTGDGRTQLGKAFRTDYVAAGTAEPPAPEKLAKMETKYLRAPAVVLVGCSGDDDLARHREDLFAVAAGVQNLLLAATAAGLRSLWSSPPVIVGSTVCRLAGFPDDTELVAVVYLGHPAPIS